ncbi:MAG: MFS transporter [Methanobrevibacter sp.]|uniref:MFS transporter n=1 Tax=Methanobrevibacter sp. TaxID=66852 RepID=UPI0026E0E9AD|nr:MFS transporter [Methanobrevibacter sp.]MDO5848609.1 MFS transporter [Methanobrevibacter sp.]
MDNFEKYVLVIAAVTSFFTVFLSSAVMISVPSLAVEFGMSNIVQNWVTMLFFLSVAAVTVPAGQISGKFGLKKTMVFGMVLYIISSIVCVFSISKDMFLICRIFQGAGAGFLNVAAMAMVVSAFKPQDRGQAIGLTVVGVYLATSLSPVIGGFLNFSFGWRSIFYITLPFLFLCLGLLITKINKEWVTFKDKPLDTKGSVLYAVGIVLFIFGFTMLNETTGVILTVVGLILIAIFVVTEIKVKAPVFDVRLFKNSKFSSANFAALCAYLATFAIVTIINYYLQYIRGLDSSQAGMILLITPVFQVVMAPIAGRISDKINPQILSAVGIGFGALGIFLISIVDTTTPLIYLMVAMAFQGFGFGLFSSPNTNAIMGSVHPKDTPIASASVATMRVIGQTLSMGMFTLIFAYIMGNVPIIPANYHLLMLSCQLAAGICTVLCVVSIFSSLVGIRSKAYYDKS